MIKSARRSFGLFGGAALALLLSCTGQVGEQGGGAAPAKGAGNGTPGGKDPVTGKDPTPNPPAYEPVTPRIYLTKVKSLLVGLAPTDDELAAVTKNPNALRAMVDAWFVTPQAQAKFFAFFKNAFQQTQIGAADLTDQGLTRLNSAPLMVAVTESFARTTMKLITDGQPFTNVLTTRTYMMTPALMALYLYIDQSLRSDDEKRSASIPMPDGTLATTIKAYATYLPPATPGAPAGVIPLSESLDPKSPNFLRFAIAQPFHCPMPMLDATGHAIVDANNKLMAMDVPYNERVFETPEGVFSLLFGLATNPSASTMLPPLPVMPDDVQPMQKQYYQRNNGCIGDVGVTLAITADDSIWRPVKVRAPMGNERMVPFYDLATLRQADTLLVRAPRLGFFTTPAFFANWQTNKSNQSRDVMNQALIVAIGRSINPIDSGPTTILDTGKDGEHSDPNGPCYSCHQILDPMRQVFAKSYTYAYRRQENAAQRFSTATFKMGVTANLESLDDLATTLANHPAFAAAWTQKLCYYANSGPCGETDPEFQRVAAAFKDSNFDFHTLVSELFSSPLITGAKVTKTWSDQGEVISIARQDHLCASLTNKLRLPTNVCGSIANRTQAQIVSNNIPADGYLRGAEGPLLSTDATMFFRGAAETMCQIAADLVIDLTKGKSLYTSGQKDPAITDFVGNIMNLGTNDPTSGPATKILQDHYTAAIAKGATPTAALKSTFVVACTSPTSLAIGL